MKILVMVGTQDKEFTRLTQKIENIVNKKDNVIVQSGHTNYESNKVDVRDFIKKEELTKLMKESDLIITHAGVGSILECLKLKKKVIVVPRLKEFKEHTNDHQLEITKSFTELGYVLPVYDIKDLKNVIKQADKFKPKTYKSNNKDFTLLVKNIIESYM